MAIIETIRKHRDSFRRNIDIIVIGLIVYSAITIAIETLAGLPPGVEVFLDVSRIVLTGIFTVEYVIRGLHCEKQTTVRVQFLRNH